MNDRDGLLIRVGECMDIITAHQNQSYEDYTIFAVLSEISEFLSPTDPVWGDGKPFCGNCGNRLYRGSFCQVCGRKVRWHSGD